MSLQDSSMTRNNFITVKDSFVNSFQDVLNEHSGVQVEFHAALEQQQGLE